MFEVFDVRYFGVRSKTTQYYPMTLSILFFIPDSTFILTYYLSTGEIENLIYSRRCCHFEWSLRPCLICFLDAILDNNVQNAGVVVYL